MNQVNESPKLSVFGTVLLLGLFIALLVAVGLAGWWWWTGPHVFSRALVVDTLIKGWLAWALLFTTAALTWWVVLNGVRKLVKSSWQIPSLLQAKPVAHKSHPALVESLQHKYGFFWRLKVRFLSSSASLNRLPPSPPA